MTNLNTPYYACIFTSTRTNNDGVEYNNMMKNMLELIKKQPSFLGVESARNEVGITVSYWQDLQSIKNWKEHAKHQLAQKGGKEKWYEEYHVRICKVEKEYAKSALD